MAPIPEMDTIWMDGALVPWADAKVHVLTHALHYGSGVFEGIRAYKTERGVAAGGNINPEGVSMFEPIGGSAPKYTGMGVINPIAAIAAGAMMLETLGEEQAAEDVERAAKEVTGTKMKSMASGQMGYSTSEVGDLVANALA